MSADVEVVLRAFDALRRRAHDDAAAFAEDAVWQNTASFPGPATCAGREAIAAFWDGLIEDFDEDAGEQRIERAAEAGGAVVVELHSVGRGRASDVPVDVRWAAAVTVADGAIRRVEVHGDWSKALAAAGPAA